MLGGLPYRFWFFIAILALLTTITLGLFVVLVFSRLSAL